MILNNLPQQTPIIFAVSFNNTFSLLVKTGRYVSLYLLRAAVPTLTQQRTNLTYLKLKGKKTNIFMKNKEICISTLRTLISKLRGVRSE